MEFKLAEFIDSPSLEIFDRCTKADLVALADHYEVSVLKQAQKTSY